MEELEIEEFERVKYIRDDETPFPWTISNLAEKLPEKASLGFYGLNKFSVFKGGGAKCLEFPNFTYVSNNYYKAEWSVNKTLRRLKNVIMVLEWHPLTHGGMTDPKAYIKNLTQDWSKALPMSAKLEDFLKRSFSLLDRGNTGKLQYEAIEEV
jgi:hypothetical protein